MGKVRTKRLAKVSCCESEVKALDLIATAELLSEHPRIGRPLETNLRRAISTAYYAFFHCLAENCADMVVGGPGARRSREAWRQVYRALNHGYARRRCNYQNEISKFPSEIRRFARLFVQMQELRHDADYDPYAEIPTRAEVIQHIGNAENTIRQFPNAPILDRRSFAVHVLLSGRRN